MATFNKFRSFVEYVAEKVINLETDTLKFMLTNTAPVNTNTVKANITEIAAGNGYTAGGAGSAVVSSGQTAGVYKLVISNVSWTASGGSIGPFRYVVLYDDTPTSPADPLVGWFDYGTALTLGIGETFTITVDATAGILTIT